jgi:hypothetical protein
MNKGERKNEKEKMRNKKEQKDKKIKKVEKRNSKTVSYCFKMSTILSATSLNFFSPPIS